MSSSTTTTAPASVETAGGWSAAGAYRSLIRRRRFIVVGLLLLALAAAVGHLAVGAGSLSPAEVVAALFTPGNAPRVDTQVMWNIRMPAVVTALVAGASLALAGAQMQTVLGNPLAEPYTLGISAAAGFGASLSIVLGAAAGLSALFGTAVLAWVFAMASCGAILLLARFRRGTGAESMILLGIAMVFLFNALLALMQYVAGDVELAQLVFWSFGNLNRTTWPQIAIMAGVFAAITPLFVRAAWRLTAFRLGDERARALGVPVDRIRTLVLVGVSLLAATTVAFTGTIGFVGLVGPHVARILVGEDQRVFVPASMLCGAALLSSASLVSNVVVPGVIVPVGIITSLVGVPVFLLIILSNRRRLWS